MTENLEKVRVAMTGSSTLELMEQKLAESLAGRGLEGELYFSGYGQYRQEILDALSGLYEFAPDFIFLVIDAEEVLGEILASPLELDRDQSRELARARAGEVLELCQKAIEGAAGARLFVSNLAASAAAMGTLEGNSPFSVKTAIRAFNDRLEEGAEALSGIFVLDWEGLALKHGLDTVFDPRLWYLARTRQGRAGQQFLADLMARTISASKNPMHKCLVLDLDNTLWGGVIGEEGLGGITLGDNGPGLAFQEFQRGIQNLRRRGIVLAISSKNNMEDVMEVLEKHPDMILRIDDFAVIAADWRDKGTHLKEIAETLDLGLDSFVFMDDNPAERELVRQTCPQVHVVEMPADPSRYGQTLNGLELFDSYSLTDEDLRRGEMYGETAKRRKSMSQAPSLEEFHRSLEMTAAIEKDNQIEVARIAQLTQKTNQFNLTTRRYTEPEILGFMESGRHHVYSLRLGDRFGDSGLVGIGILEEKGNAWHLDNFLMSCRVIGRDAEGLLIWKIAEDARKSAMAEITGEFLPTKKNKIAESFFADHDFAPVPASATGWNLDISKTGLAPPQWINLLEN